MERRFAGLRRVKIQDKYFTRYAWGYKVMTFSHEDVKLNMLISSLNNHFLLYF